MAYGYEGADEDGSEPRYCSCCDFEANLLNQVLLASIISFNSA